MDHGCRCHGQRGLINVNISNHGWWLGADTERYTPAVALCVFKVSRGKLSIQYIGSIQRVSKNIWQYHNNDITIIIIIIMQEILLTAVHWAEQSKIK